MLLMCEKTSYIFCSGERVRTLQLQPPRPATGVSRALRARSVQSVPPRVSPKTGVSEGVSEGGSPGPFGPRAPECPKSVPTISRTLCSHSGDTLGTLFGHSGARGPKDPWTPLRTLPRTPPFSGTPSGAHSGHLNSGPKGPRDSCSRSGGLQHYRQLRCQPTTNG